MTELSWPPPGDGEDFEETPHERVLRKLKSLEARLIRHIIQAEAGLSAITAGKAPDPEWLKSIKTDLPTVLKDLNKLEDDVNATSSQFAGRADVYNISLKDARVEISSRLARIRERTVQEGVSGQPDG